MGLFSRKNAPSLPKVAPDVPDADPASRVMDAMVARIRQVEPGFTLEGFLPLASERFLLVKEALWSQDLDALRALLTEPGFERLSHPVEVLHSRRQVYLVEGLELLDASVLRAPEGAVGLVVRFTYRTASERTVHALSGAVFSDHGGSHHREDFLFHLAGGKWLLDRVSVLS